jgi:hypothetical protein
LHNMDVEGVPAPPQPAEDTSGGLLASFPKSQGGSKKRRKPTSVTPKATPSPTAPSSKRSRASKPSAKAKAAKEAAKEEAKMAKAAPEKKVSQKRRNSKVADPPPEDNCAASVQLKTEVALIEKHHKDLVTWRNA